MQPQHGRPLGETSAAIAEPAAAESTESPSAGEERSTPLELFFDLVFIYAVTQTSHLLTLDSTVSGFARAAVLLGAIWYAWICFAWLTNTVDVEDPVVRGGIVVAAGASLLVAIAVPHALSDDVVLFVTAYFAVRLLHVVLYAYGLRREPHARRTILGMAPTFVVGPGMLFALPFLPESWRLPFLLGALVLDVSSPYISGVRGLRVRPSHFAERFALFVIIVLGESIVSIGVGAQRGPLTASVIAAVALDFALTVLLWWAYFDIVALAAEERLRHAKRRERAVLARDAYTYLHFPLVAGIVAFAYGCKAIVLHPTSPLQTAGAVGLCGGVALYMLGHAAFRLRMTRSPGLHHWAAGAALLLLLPVAPHISALACGVAVALILLAAIAWEHYELRDRRRELRSA